MPSSLACESISGAVAIEEGAKMNCGSASFIFVKIALKSSMSEIPPTVNGIKIFSPTDFTSSTTVFLFSLEVKDDHTVK